MQMRVAVLIAAGVLAAPAAARAQVTTEHSASIVVFPKVIADGTSDSTIQLSNASANTVHAHCWYTDGALQFSGLPPGPSNPPRWSILEFDLTLTKQQPTNWVASRGREVDASDTPCSNVPANFDCYGAGFDPGSVPALPEGFTGELRCVETDAIGAPVSGNHLTGEATLENVQTGDVSKYSAIGIAGLDSNDNDNLLRLGEEYVGCPESLVLDFTPDGSPVAGVGDGSAVHNELTIVPCSSDLQNQLPATIVVSFSIINEFEQQLTNAASVQCWENMLLQAQPVFTAAVLGSPTAQVRMQPAQESAGGFLAVAEERRSAADASVATASAAVNLYVEGARATTDVIALP
jgi:hypothetical protein